ncbi:LysR family transcriptional regulator [Paraburkholderia hospita]|uniref:LysR family transcriptional regulator n=1 Tax=Paraburkholderia hospita TaxID=169430 RepID=UPI000271AD87|nr:LysR family transcriptional regulator [Paraburkholderia hospita]EUC18813.1 transcriptional regulator, LysR family [Burkholderia sp. BT03]SKC60759.1 DNA-binding transcriptional regulator, LysR family [Paraburkholderia hospita]
MKDLNLLYVFEALWRDRSVTAAAENLGLTQAAVSSALKRMRDAYGDKLFMLVGRRMEPTPLAANIATALIESLNLVRGTTGTPPPFSPARARRIFTIRTRDIGEVTFLPTLHRELQRLAPNTSLHTVFEPIEATVAGLSSGRIDVALGFLPALEQDIHRKVLFTQRYVCVMRKGHPLDGRSIDKKTFLEHDHLLVENSGSGHRRLERALIDAGAREKIKIRVPQYLAAPHCLLDSDLIWTVPEMLAVVLSRYYPLTFQPEPLQIEPFEIALYWHDRYHKEPSNMWFRRLINELFLNATSETVLDRRLNQHEEAKLEGDHSDCSLIL